MPDSKPENIGFGGRADARESLCLAAFVPTQQNRALMRDKTCQPDRLKIERSSFADTKGGYVRLPKMVPIQQNSALMRDGPCPADSLKKERLPFADNKSASVRSLKLVPNQQNPALMRDTTCQPDDPKKERLPFADSTTASVHWLKLVPTQQNRALMRGRSCLPYGFNRSRECLLQKNVDSLKASNKGPTSVSTTDAVTARDSAQLTPSRARHT
ncbi:hypothetical protein [uncultured Thiothrix sp.]|uniref:hypothetical protein n=1 Tax=uncultured Thiothrix sp. TaxID=223185 RepID=UPI0026265AAA|nr:hypothetical protein [uncultured Thiothrix sp.]